MNIQATTGNDYLSEQIRQNKYYKNVNWIEKSKIKPTEKSDLPRSKGVEQIKLVKIT